MKNVNRPLNHFCGGSRVYFLWIIPRSKLYMQYVISTSWSRTSPGLSSPEKKVVCLSVLLTSLSVTETRGHHRWSVWSSTWPRVQTSTLTNQVSVSSKKRVSHLLFFTYGPPLHLHTKILISEDRGRDILFVMHYKAFFFLSCKIRSWWSRRRLTNELKCLRIHVSC